jgi:hypothetical protein
MCKYSGSTVTTAGRELVSADSSVQVGPAAVVTVWTDPEFKGTSFQMGTDRAYGALIEQFAGRIQSMDVSCTSAANGPPA